MSRDDLVLLLTAGLLVAAIINTGNNKEALDVAKETQEMMKNKEESDNA